MSHYHPSQPGQYPTPTYQPTPKRMPTWAKVTAVLVGVPVLVAGGCTAVFVAGTAGQIKADDPAPVISSESPTPITITTTTPKSAPTTSSTPKPAEQVPSYLPEDGTLLVGKDVKPGTYQTRVLDDDLIPSCYWARLDASGDIIDNDINLTVGARMTLKVRASDDAIEINCNGAVWKRVK